MPLLGVPLAIVRSARGISRSTSQLPCAAPPFRRAVSSDMLMRHLQPRRSEQRSPRKLHREGQRTATAWLSVACPASPVPSVRERPLKSLGVDGLVPLPHERCLATWRSIRMDLRNSSAGSNTRSQVVLAGNDSCRFTALLARAYVPWQVRSGAGEDRSTCVGSAH